MPATLEAPQSIHSFLAWMLGGQVIGAAHGAALGQGKLPSSVHHPWAKGSRSGSHPASRWLSPAGSGVRVPPCTGTSVSDAQHPPGAFGKGSGTGRASSTCCLGRCSTRDFSSVEPACPLSARRGSSSRACASCLFRCSRPAMHPTMIGRATTGVSSMRIAAGTQSIGTMKGSVRSCSGESHSSTSIACSPGAISPLGRSSSSATSRNGSDSRFNSTMPVCWTCFPFAIHRRRLPSTMNPVVTSGAAT